MSYDFKSEEDVKKYLANLYTEYSFGCYSEKKPEACHLLGEYYKSIKKDYKKSAEIYKNNCDAFDFGRSCSLFGRFSVLGEGCEKSMKTAFQYFKKGCEFNDSIGCLYAGLMAIGNTDLGESDKKVLFDDGIKFLEKGCNEHGEEKSCFALSNIYLSGKQDYVEKDWRKAYKFSLKACDLGNPFACANIAQMYMRGEGVEKNDELAETFRQRAIEIEKDSKATRGIGFRQGVDT